MRSFASALSSFLERKLGKELYAKLRFASALIRTTSVGVTLCVAPAFFFVRHPLFILQDFLRYGEENPASAHNWIHLERVYVNYR